jgi:hypothetical protein
MHFLISVIITIIITLMSGPIIDKKFESWLNKIPNRLLGLSAFLVAIYSVNSLLKKITKQTNK